MRARTRPAAGLYQSRLRTTFNLKVTFEHTLRLPVPGPVPVSLSGLRLTERVGQPQPDAEPTGTGTGGTAAQCPHWTVGSGPTSRWHGASPSAA